jgi:RimJ/RimL family protein N-acetyltransferase
VIDKTADIAWVVGVPWQRRGFAAEAAIRMCESLTEQGVEHFEAHIHPDHIASQRVAVAVGLTESDVIDEDGETVWTSQPD